MMMTSVPKLAKKLNPSQLNSILGGLKSDTLITNFPWTAKKLKSLLVWPDG